MRLFGLRIERNGTPRGEDEDTRDELRTINRRLDKLKDDIEHLGRRFTKLQAQFTRWTEDAEDEVYDDEEQDER